MSSLCVPVSSASQSNPALDLVNEFVADYKSSESLLSKLAARDLVGKAEALFALMFTVHRNKGGRTAKKFAKFTPGKLHLMYSNDDSFVVAACIGGRKCAVFDGKSVEVTSTKSANKKYLGASCEYSRKVCFKYSN